MILKYYNAFRRTSPKSYYYIKSKLNGLYLDISGCDKADGAKVVMWEKTGGDNQMWYEDPDTCTIRSKMNDKCLSFNCMHSLLRSNRLNYYIYPFRHSHTHLSIYIQVY